MVWEPVSRTVSGVDSAASIGVRIVLACKPPLRVVESFSMSDLTKQAMIAGFRFQFEMAKKAYRNAIIIPNVVVTDSPTDDMETLEPNDE